METFVRMKHNFWDSLFRFVWFSSTRCDFLWICRWQHSGRCDCCLWIITFPNYFRLTSCVFSVPSDGVFIVMMMMIVMVVGRWEPFGDDDWLPNLFPGRKPNFLPVWHPNVLDVFLPREFLVCNVFQLFAWFPNLFPCFFPGQFLVRHPNLLLCWFPDLFPCFLPRKLLVINPNLLLSRLPDLLPIFNPRQLLGWNPNCFLWRNPNLLPSTLPDKFLLPEVMGSVFPAFVIFS